jgi:hypothetical protein
MEKKADFPGNPRPALHMQNCLAALGWTPMLRMKKSANVETTPDKPMSATGAIVRQLATAVISACELQIKRTEVLARGHEVLPLQELLLAKSLR